jgi:O-antigen ligase
VFSGIIISLAFVLLVGSESSTSLFAFVILAFTGSLFYIDNQFRKISAGRLLSFITITAILIFIVYAFMETPDLVNAFLGNFGEDITFTGRTDLWQDIFHEAKKHLWLGTGYQTFWVITNDDLLKLYEVYTWLPKQAHNGYIDLINEVGIIGSVLFLLMIISYFRNVIKLKQKQIWTWFIAAVLIVNLQESTLFHGGILTGSIFIISYLIVMMRRYKIDIKTLKRDNDAPEDDEE